MIIVLLFAPCFYITFEVVFNSIFNLSQVEINMKDMNNDGKKDGLFLRFGYCSVWMAIPAVVDFFLFYLVMPFFKEIYSLPIFMVICGITVTLTELIMGLSLKKLNKPPIWDYRSKKFNYKGVICLKHSLLWVLAGIPVWGLLKLLGV